MYNNINVNSKEIYQKITTRIWLFLHAPFGILLFRGSRHEFCCLSCFFFIIYFIICKHTDFRWKAEVNAVLGQEISLELFDWDPGFPGVQNDDFLGRFGSTDVNYNFVDYC